MTDTVPEAKTTVSITVDGKPVEANSGEMIIAAAERDGTYIPRFCYHPRMRPVGMCRMCLVEVEGPRGPQLVPSCYVPVSEGQVVITDSARVKKAQDGVLEFLLVNHPLDCPVCDKGGECPLQDQTLAYGPGESRFVEEKRHWEKPISLSELVLLDRERCIQCDRCTRFADEVAGDALIEFNSRGGRTEIATFPDQPFSSYFSGNTVQICPVGALTSKPYRFKARPWDIEQVESTCTSCSVGCRVAVQSSQSQLTRYLGVDSEPVNHGWMCDKGRYDYENVNSDRRITAPLMRKNSELVEVTWNEALTAAVAALRTALDNRGTESIGVIGGARLANEDAYAWARFAKSVLGTDNVDAQLGDGLPADVVLGLPRATIDDACRASAIVLIAPDIKEELPVLYLRLRDAAVNAKIPVIEVSPMATGMTRYATASYFYEPGNASATVREVMPSHELDDAVVVFGRPSLAESATSIVDALLLLREVSGVKFLPALRRSNIMGALEMGFAPGLLPGGETLDAGHARYERAWGKVVTAPGTDTPGMLRAAANGQMETIILLGADPIRDLPDADLARRGLAGAQTVIAVQSHPTASMKDADIVVPASTYAERGGTTTNIEGRVTSLSQKLTPPGVAWDDWVIANELAYRMGADLGFSSLPSLRDEIERTVPSHAGLTARALNANRDGIVSKPAAAEFPTTRSSTTTSNDAVSPNGAVLRLVTSRKLYDQGTLVQHSPCIAGLAAAPVVLVHQHDFEQLGLVADGLAKVTSNRASLTVAVAVDHDVLPGTAWMGWNLDDANPVSELIDASGSICEVRVERA